jgi:hypothetical protein
MTKRRQTEKIFAPHRLGEDVSLAILANSPVASDRCGRSEIPVLADVDELRDSSSGRYA